MHAAMICIWPELLLCKVETQLVPFVAYLRDLGCSTSQLAEMLMICPHLLGEAGWWEAWGGGGRRREAGGDRWGDAGETHLLGEAGRREASGGWEAAGEGRQGWRVGRGAAWGEVERWRVKGGERQAILDNRRSHGVGW